MISVSVGKAEPFRSSWRQSRIDLDFAQYGRKSWWENQIDPTLRFGIPMGCWKTLDGKCSENNQMEPDIRVANEPDVMATGRDQQIEAAVRELMKKK